MIADGHIENRADFEHKLQLLDDQWQSVVLRATQRKAILQAQVNQWRTYNDLLSRLKLKLDDITRSLSTLDVKSAPLQQLKLLLNSCQVSGYA